MGGPLQGLRVIEMVGLGPCPFAAMMLADMGAEVIRIDRKAAPEASNAFPVLGTEFDVVARGRRSLAMDLKCPQAVAVFKDLIAQADVLIEGFRPGVMERLGLGPEPCLSIQPRLIYGRITGWGQSGPLAQAAGHDLNYIALSGVLHPMGRADTPPAPPLNLVGDYGGGGMLLAYGVMCALWETRRSGAGQVVDAAMVEGAALMGSFVYGLHAHGMWQQARGTNLLDGAAHFYDTYRCLDGKFISIGSIEPKFYALLLRLTGLDPAEFARQLDRSEWPLMKKRMTELFATKTRAQWCTLMEGTDVCFAPVLDLTEAPEHAHHRAREAFFERDGVTQPAPAPRFSRSAVPLPSPPAAAGVHSHAILRDWGISDQAIAELQALGAIATEAA